MWAACVMLQAVFLTQLRAQLGEQSFAIAGDAPQEWFRGRGAGVVLPAPRNQIEHGRKEVEPFLGETKAPFSTSDKPHCLKVLEARGQNVCRYPLFSGEKVSVRAPLREHQVAKDDEAPGVAERLDREVDRAI